MITRKNTKNSSKPTRICDHPDCEEAGTCRAPKDRSLRDYYWFCQKHVAQYNKNWDFLKEIQGVWVIFSVKYFFARQKTGVVIFTLTQKMSGPVENK